LIRARTKAALRAKRARGERAGTLPFGFTLGSDGRTLQPHPDEQATLEIVRARRAEGLSLRDIAAELNRLGRVTRRGSRYQHQHVYNLLLAA
jgi:DNA invertase Pin-like site-specific DNA recombinase